MLDVGLFDESENRLKNWMVELKWKIYGIFFDVRFI